VDGDPNPEAQGGSLAPGQLLSVYPPLVMRPDAAGYSYRAIAAADRLGFLAALAAQVRDLADGTGVRLVIREPGTGT
jgi:hypothetical protein